MGPNVKRLIIRKMAADAIPSGGGLAAGLHFLRSAERIRQGMAGSKRLGSRGDCSGQGIA